VTNKSILVIGPSLKMGGIERASSTFANELSALGYKVIYLAVFQHEKFFELDPAITFDEPDDGSNITRLDLFKTIKRIRRQVIHYNPDGILAFNKFYAALASLALIFTRYQLTVTERSSPFFYWRLKLRLINRLAFFLKRPKGVLAQTNIAAEHQRRYYGTGMTIRVIPNPVRPIKLYPEIERTNFILAVGRLDDYLKGFDRLLDVLVKVDPSWPLVFAGGSDNQKLKQKINKLGLSERVKFIGAVRILDPVYAEAGIFVIPSLSEGFPNVLCEAMASGLPCVSFDFTAGPRDLIENGVNGILVDDGDIVGMATAINRLIRDEKMRKHIGENAKQIRERLDAKIIARQTADFILS
jgi:GalNAc-alpha-(1->4)-GalNAc-alpha-(1->3)-diNAcBac-PP-undecaprenol alpha-1,4-N-acetyl-D-galactosaminyltransferase